MGDSIGDRRTLLATQCLFAFGVILTAPAQSMLVFISAGMVQGLGSAYVSSAIRSLRAAIRLRRSGERSEWSRRRRRSAVDWGCSSREPRPPSSAVFLIGAAGNVLVLSAALLRPHESLIEPVHGMAVCAASATLTAITKFFARATVFSIELAEAAVLCVLLVRRHPSKEQ